MSILSNAVRNVGDIISSDFDAAARLLPFWINYPPEQRGRQPRGDSIPWSEVGETSIGANVVRSLIAVFPDLLFPGLPSGADIRFMTGDALVHFDIKLTGPNDRPDEIVASPNQISGDGAGWRNGAFLNSKVSVKGKRATMEFQPELPPFYIYDQKTLPCLTFFLKGVYVVEGIGIQPVDYLEVSCVPNGLLLFDGPKYADHYPGLLIPGKDEHAKKKKRTRVRLEPLGRVAAWRREVVWQRTPIPS